MVMGCLARGKPAGPAAGRTPRGRFETDGSGLLINK
jgi:hypothetical protein